MIQMAQRQTDLMKDQSILSAAQSRLKSKGYNNNNNGSSSSTSTTTMAGGSNHAIADRVSALSKRHVSDSLESSNSSVMAKRRRAMAAATKGARNGILLARGGAPAHRMSLEEGEEEEEEEEKEDGFVTSAATENSVVVIGMSPGCCMCHVAKRLLCSLGVNPTIIEVGGQHTEAALEAALRRKLEPCESAPSPSSSSGLIPAVFIGGRLIGGVDSLMSAHISGHLIPQLKEAGALWL